ncbi:MAG: hypothetical protein IPO23_11635 [Flavobacterium sp.]|nr:hypothetical protein [Flavobacterium sp.]
MKKKYLVLVFLLLSVIASAQYGYRDGNRIGITLGVTQTTLSTKTLIPNQN